MSVSAQTHALGEQDAQVIDFLNDWDDCPKSFGNGFTAHMDGQPSQFASIRIFQAASTSGKSSSQTAVEVRERVEASGRNIGTIAGMSVYGDTSGVDPRKFHVTTGG